MLDSLPMHVAETETETLEQVNLIYELLDQAEATPPRWSRHGVGLRLAASIKSRARFGHATLRRLSTSGMLLSSAIRLHEGDLLLVKVGRWGTDQFSFPCRVQRVTEEDGTFHLMLGFTGKPLRVRYAL